MILLGKIALGLVGATVAGAGLLCSEGFVNVNVVRHERHDNGQIHVIAPAMLAPIAVRLIPSYKLYRASEKIQPWLPTIHAAIEGLNEAPDLTIVEVSDPDEYVQVTKSGSRVLVDVADVDETVHVSVPIKAIDSTVSALAAAAPGPDAHADRL